MRPLSPSLAAVAAPTAHGAGFPLPVVFPGRQAGRDAFLGQQGGQIVNSHPSPAASKAPVFGKPHPSATRTRAIGQEAAATFAQAFHFPGDPMATPEPLRGLAWNVSHIVLPFTNEKREWTA